MKITPKIKKSLKKPKKLTQSQLNKRVWKEVGRINRIINPPVCYTCGATGLSGINWHPGHGKPKGLLKLRFKYDLRNIKSQCIKCNLNGGGMTDIFISKLEKEKEGLEFLNEACVKINNHWEIKEVPSMGSIEAWNFLSNLLEEYKKIEK